MEKENFKYKHITYPHGIGIMNNEVSAIFKLFISISPSENVQTSEDINVRRKYEASLGELNINSINIIFDYLNTEFKNIISKKKNKLNVMDNVLSAKDHELKNVNFTLIPTEKNSVKEFKIPEKLSKTKIEGKSFNLLISDDNDISNIKTIKEDDYDRILKKGRDFAISQEGYENKNTLNIITFYNKLLEEPILAEELGLIHTFYLPLTNVFNNESQCIHYNFGELNADGKSPYKLCKYGSKYYNGLAKEFLSTKGDKKDFEYSEVTFFDKYKKNLNTDNTENDGLYINAKYYIDESSGNIMDPFTNNNIFGFNVLMQIKNEDDKDYKDFDSLSLLKKTYFNEKGKYIAEDISSGYLLPNTTIETAPDEEHLPELLFAWKGENLALNRLVKERKIEPEDEFDEVLTKHNNDVFLNDLIDENFKIVESYVPETNSHLEASDKFTYHFYIRTVTPLNYYLETEREWILSNPGKDLPGYILFFEDLHKINEFKDIVEFDSSPFPKFKIDSSVVISRESFDNENTGYVDSKNTMVVNFLDNESCEKRYLYPARITWERFKLLGFLKNEKIKADTINQYVRRCMRLERRSLKKIRENQGINKKINYLADPRAFKVAIVPNDLFTAQYFSELEQKGEKIPIQNIFSLQEKYPYYNNAKGVKIEAVKEGSSNNLNINEKSFFKKLPVGAYAIKIHSHHADNQNIFEKNGKLLEKNGEPLNFAFINKPQPPTLPKNFNNSDLAPSRFNTNEINKWRLSYPLKVNSDYATKSIKYYEETRVLKLQHEDLDNLINNFEGDIDAFHLLNEEYPVELFISNEGNLNESLQTNSYPEKLTLKIRLERNLCGKNQEIFRLKLSEKDEIIVIADKEKSNFKLLHNGSSIEFDSTEIDFDVCHSEEDEKFMISSDGLNFIKIENKIQTISETSSLCNFINPELSTRDIQVANKIELKNSKIVNGQEYLSQTYDKNIIKLIRNPNEIILKDEGHPFYRKKKIKLFASSAFQGYFPTKSKEEDIGSCGDELEFEVLNNIIPEAPELETDLILYNHQQKSWGINNQISEERSFLVRITLDQSFMREGTQNKFAIILGKYENSSCLKFIENDTEDISVIGEDITRLISPDILELNNLDDFINRTPERVELKKYFANPKTKSNKNNLEKLLDLGEKNICIDGSYFKILVCQPFYNVDLKKWQIVLSFKNPKEDNPNKTIEAFFIKLIGFKIAYGQSVVSYNKENKCYLLSDCKKSNTILSSFTKTPPIPIHNSKRFTLKRINKDIPKVLPQLEIINENYREGERKLYIVSKLKVRTKNNLFVKDILYEDYEIFEGQGSVIFDNYNNYREIIIREFEKHDNYYENNVDFTKLPIKGLRLINYVQFKI